MTRPFEPDAPVNAEEYLASQPPVLEVPGALTKIRQRVIESGRRVIVLDEDPTGTQTVHDVPALTAWSYSELRWALEQPNPVVYVLTNSRNLDEPDAVALNERIGRRLRHAASDSGGQFVVASRSDSPLRGHYPSETDALERELGAFDGVIVCPCYFEASHLTVDDVQWVRQGAELVPAALTEPATDPTFGYSSSNLAGWIEEKTGGRTPAQSLLRVGIADIREGGPERIAALLQGARDAQPIVVNAAEYADLEVFVLGLLEAEAAGKSFLYRTGPSFVRARGGIPERQPLEARDLYRGNAGGGGPGLVLVGSHARQTTLQLREAKKLDGLSAVELSAPRLLDPERRTGELDRVVERVNEMLPSTDVIVYTSREVVGSSGNLSGLEVGSAVSAALVEVTRRVDRGLELGFVVAKGGITSSEVATKGLGVRRAEVMGQMLPGMVPAWVLPEDSGYPGLPYVVFPDNVGEESALAKVIQKLRGGTGQETTGEAADGGER